jgi:hypothetical protein
VRCQSTVGSPLAGKIAIGKYGLVELINEGMHLGATHGLDGVGCGHESDSAADFVENLPSKVAADRVEYAQTSDEAFAIGWALPG